MYYNKALTLNALMKAVSCELKYLIINTSPFSLMKL